MRIARTLPPAAAPISWKSIASGLCGVLHAEQERARFTEEIKAYFNKRYCFLFSSGRAGLTVTLLALKHLFPERSRVLIPAFNCYSVPSAIKRAGLQVAVCDVATGSFNFNPDRLPNLLNDPRLLCVIPTHLFGINVDITSLLEHRHPSVTIIEDAAQAFGGDCQGVQLGTQGDVGLFSLGRGKAYSVVAGGVVVTDRSDLAEAISAQMQALEDLSFPAQASLLAMALAMRLFLTPTTYWLPHSLPFLRLGETVFDPRFFVGRMSGFQAGMSRGWEKRLTGFREVRRRNVENLTSLVKKRFPSPFVTRRTCQDLIRFPVLCESVPQRSRLLRESHRLGLGLAPAYPEAISNIPELKQDLDGSSCPVAEGLSRLLLTLPVHPLITDTDRRRIETLLELSESGRPLPLAGQPGGVGCP